MKKIMYTIVAATIFALSLTACTEEEVKVSGGGYPGGGHVMDPKIRR